MKLLKKRKYAGSQRALAYMVYKFFDTKTGSGLNVNEHLAEEWHKPVIKRFKRRKVFARFKDNIWAADLAEMGSLSSKNKYLNIYYVSFMFSLNMHGLNHRKIKKVKQFLILSLK